MEDSKQKILEAARVEFSRHGLEGARVDRIAVKSKINKAMIYYYFHSKEGLYQAVFDSIFERVKEFIEMAQPAADSLDDFLLKLSEFYNIHLATEKALSPLLLRELASGGERLRNAISKMVHRRGLQRKLIDFIDQGIKEGKLRKVDGKQAIISFIAMNIFYLLMAPVANEIWEIGDAEKFRKERPKEIVELFLYGIKKK
jgi:TetR/AcrR family transcriptional regulator